MRLPLGEGDHRVVAAVSRDIGGAVAGEALPRMDERRFHEGRAGLPGRALQGPDPLARDRMHDLGAVDGVAQGVARDERGRQDPVDQRPDAPTADRHEHVAHAVLA